MKTLSNDAAMVPATSGELQMQKWGSVMTDSMPGKPNTMVGFVSLEQVKKIKLEGILNKFHVNLKGQKLNEEDITRKSFLKWTFSYLYKKLNRSMVNS